MEDKKFAEEAAKENDIKLTEREGGLYKRIYGHLETEHIYAQAIIDFLAGMTDVYATKAFEQLLMC